MPTEEEIADKAIGILTRPGQRTVVEIVEVVEICQQLLDNLTDLPREFEILMEDDRLHLHGPEALPGALYRNNAKYSPLAFIDYLRTKE